MEGISASYKTRNGTKQTKQNETKQQSVDSGPDATQLEAMGPDCRQTVTLARHRVHFSWTQSNTEGVWTPSNAEAEGPSYVDSLLCSAILMIS